MGPAALGSPCHNRLPGGRRLADLCRRDREGAQWPASVAANDEEMGTGVEIDHQARVTTTVAVVVLAQILFRGIVRLVPLPG